MKSSFLILVLLVACAKEHSSKKPGPGQGPNPNKAPVEITDPLDGGVNQQQDDGDFQLRRTYSGTNVVLNYQSPSHLGMIRIKGKDAEKLHKHMALTSIQVQSAHVKRDLEAKVGPHVLCRPDACWMYVDYKNGDVIENRSTSDAAKAPRVFLPYKGENLELRLFKSSGRIFFSGMDAKALYSVMELSEEIRDGKGGSSSTKTGQGIECVKSNASAEKTEYACQVKFNHRTGGLRFN